MLRRLLTDRAANIPMVVCILAIPMVVIAGGGIDFMVHERNRAALQHGLDRGVLAAASLTQTKPIDETVDDYVKAAGLSGFALQVDSQVTVNSRVVTASATMASKTTFLDLLGIGEMQVAARSKAEERRQKLEISMVLDLSGSMREKNRLPALRPAAKSFITRLIRDDTKAHTSMSLIPYAGQVSVGKAALDALAAGATTPVRRHDTSSCFGNLDKTFSAAIPDFTKAEHVSQFSTWVYSNWVTANKGYAEGFDPWNCPTEETSVTFLTNDTAKLTAEIDKYKMFDGTATHIAMKWGLHLLDPAFKPSLAKMAANGGPTVPAVFADRPASFTGGETIKVIVLMTDGEVVAQQRPKTDLIVNPQPTASGTTAEKVSQSVAIKLMTETCDAAKQKGIVIYTIGFDVLATSATFLEKLRNCASSPSHYYDATSKSIDGIFQNIAGAIERVRLVSY